MKKTHIKKIVIGVVLIILVFALFDTIIGDWINIFELKIVDLKFRQRESFNKSPDFSDDIVFVNIDNYSKEKSGITLWPKKYYADLIEKIAEKEAGVIAVDILFGASPDTLGNTALVNSIANAGNVISPYLVKFTSENENKSLSIDPHIYNAFAFDINPETNASEISSISDLLYYPLIKLIEQSFAMGYANIEPDEDGVLRRIPILSAYNNRLALSFFFQSVCSYLDYPLENIIIVNQSKIILKDFPVSGEQIFVVITPLDADGNMIINYAGSMFNDNVIQSYSAWDLLHSSSEDISFTNKLVILSDISTAAKDYCATPYDNVLWNSYIFANAINTVLSQRYIQPWPDFSVWIIIGLLSALMIIVYARFNNIWFNLLSILLIVLFMIINSLSFIIFDSIMPFFHVILSIIFVYLFLSISKYYSTEIEKVKLESQLQSYLSPVLMNKIKKNPDILKVGGKRKFITVLFSDIVNFTGFCDESDPAAVQEVLKEYFDVGVDLVFKNNGIVDKYLGDGMLAFFENDDINSPSQISAINCALEFQEAAVKLNEYFSKRINLDFRIRIGVATGYAKVGNIGPVQKTDYTIIGSVVNLASRLEGIGDAGEITFDEWTLKELKDKFEYVDIGKQTIKGYKKPVKVYKIKNNLEEK